MITSNKDHPAFDVKADNLHIICQDEPSLGSALQRLYTECGCERLTVQTGGTLNAALIAEGLIDYVDIVVAPVLIGGKDTASIVDGPSITTREELSRLGVLRLIEATPLSDSYLRLRYEVVH